MVESSKSTASDVPSGRALQRLTIPECIRHAARERSAGRLRGAAQYLEAYLAAHEHVRAERLAQVRLELGRTYRMAGRDGLARDEFRQVACMSDDMDLIQQAHQLLDELGPTGLR